MRDWRDAERDWQMEEIYQRSGGGYDDIIETLVYIVIGIAVVLGIAGFLDSHFHWGLTEWIWAQIHQWTGGVLGKPAK